MNAGRQALWERVYDTASDAYGPIPGYNDRDARLTADAAAAGWYSGDRRRNPAGRPRTPRPGNLLNLTPNRGGQFVDLDYVMPDGEIRGVRFPGETHALLWSADLQAALVLPRMRLSACEFPPTTREDQLARMWAKGRGAKCAARARFELPALPYVFPGIQVSYISDKFTHGTMKEYVHHFGPGVLIYFSAPPRGKASPDVIMMRGGGLRLTKHGIDG